MTNAKIAKASEPSWEEEKKEEEEEKEEEFKEEEQQLATVKEPAKHRHCA